MPLIPGAPGAPGTANRVGQVEEQQRVLTRPLSNVNPQVTSISTARLERGLADASDVAFQWQDTEDTAAAKQADVAFASQVRDLLYSPESGFMNLQQANAVTGYKDVNKRL